MLTETEKKSHKIIKNIFNIKYFEKILKRQIEVLITANNNTILKVNAIIERLEKNNSHNLPTS